MLVSNSPFYLQTISSITNHIDNFGNIFLTSIMIRGFHHHTHHRLRAGFTNQNTASIPQCFSHILYRCLHSLVVLCCLAVIALVDVLFDIHRITDCKVTVLNHHLLRNLPVFPNRCGPLGSHPLVSARCQVLDNFFHK